MFTTLLQNFLFLPLGVWGEENSKPMRQLSALATFSNCVLQFEISVRAPAEETVPSQKISVLVSHTHS